MRRFSLAALFVSVALFLFSCSSSKKMSARFVPFTASLKSRLERDSIDLKQVQFYVDQKIILSRYLGSQKAEVTSGVVKFENGQYMNEVIVPAFTPGLCEDIVNGRLMISFEKGNNNIAFGLGSGYTAGNYVIYGTDWKNGTTAVTFDSNKFRARCGSCSDVASAMLVVKKSEIDKMQKKTRTVKGRKIGS
ncbi:MAG: hypothetical protein P4L51_09060 [Puia sp.]|nr:hypothetical protein [Puia sp.]